MAGSEGSESGSWGDGIAQIINAVTKLYQAVAENSPHVADTVVVLACLFPFYAVYAGTSRIGSRERQADKAVHDALDAKKPGEGKPKRRKP